MIDDILLSEAEQAFVDKFLADAYYPAAGSAEAIFEQLLTLTGPSQAKIADVCLSTTAIQQRLRRDFILQKIFGQIKALNRKEAEVLIAKLGQSPTATGSMSALVTELGFETQPVPVVETLDQETTDQITMFNTVDQECQQLFGLIYGKYNVGPYYPLLNQLSTEDLTSLAQAIKSFIATLAAQEAKALFQQAAVPRIISDILGKTQLGTLLDKPASMADAGILLRNLLFITTGIAKNRAQPTPLPDAEVLASIGRLFYLTDTPLNFEQN